MLFKLEQIRADEASDDERECNLKFMESRKSHKLKCCGWRYLFGNRREQASKWVSEWEIPEIPKKKLCCIHRQRRNRIGFSGKLSNLDWEWQGWEWKSGSIEICNTYHINTYIHTVYKQIVLLEMCEIFGEQKAKTIFISFQISREFFHFHLNLYRCMVATTSSLQQRPTTVVD